MCISHVASRPMGRRMTNRRDRPVGTSFNRPYRIPKSAWCCLALQNRGAHRELRFASWFVGESDHHRVNRGTSFSRSFSVANSTWYDVNSSYSTTSSYRAVLTLDLPRAHKLDKYFFLSFWIIIELSAWRITIFNFKTSIKLLYELFVPICHNSVSRQN